MFQRPYRPYLLPCTPCGVLWEPAVSALCWVCGERSDEKIKQVWPTSQASLSSEAASLEAGVITNDPRDWHGDPCGWRSVVAVEPAGLGSGLLAPVGVAEQHAL